MELALTVFFSRHALILKLSKFAGKGLSHSHIVGPGDIASLPPGSSPTLEGRLNSPGKEQSPHPSFQFLCCVVVVLNTIATTGCVLADTGLSNMGVSSLILPTLRSILYDLRFWRMQPAGSKPVKRFTGYMVMLETYAPAGASWVRDVIGRAEQVGPGTLFRPLCECHDYHHHLHARAFCKPM